MQTVWPGSEVILADPIDDNREPFAIAFSQAGYWTCEAVTGLETLHRLETQKIDLVITELTLPDIDGLELARRIRARPLLRRTPVVALTALPLTRSRREDVQAVGFDLLFQKPCQPSLLVKHATELMVTSVALREASRRAQARVQMAHVAARASLERAVQVVERARVTIARAALRPLIGRMRAEYRISPTLRLTRFQAARLFLATSDQCQLAFDILEAEEFLTRLSDGSYRRTE
jgi:CheY-like chemotaxis protein